MSKCFAEKKEKHGQNAVICAKDRKSAKTPLFFQKLLFSLFYCRYNKVTVKYIYQVF